MVGSLFGNKNQVNIEVIKPDEKELHTSSEGNVVEPLPSEIKEVDINNVDKDFADMVRRVNERREEKENSMKKNNKKSIKKDSKENVISKASKAGAKLVKKMTSKIKKSNGEKKKEEEKKERILVSIRDIDDNHVELYSGDNKVSIIMDTSDTWRDPKLVREYYEKLLNNEIKPEPYFTKKDGKIYKYVKAFLTADLSDPKTVADRHNLITYLNLRHRQLLGYSYRNEEREAELVIKSYETGSEMIFGENVLKNMAWFACHSYLMDIFASEQIIWDIVPKHNPDLVPIWNSFISQMHDIPYAVKSLFVEDDEGVCEFLRHYSEPIVPGEALKFKSSTARQLIVTPEDRVPASLETEHPSDSNEDEKFVPVKEVTPEEKAYYERISAEEAAMNQAYQDAIAKDEPKDNVTMKVTPEAPAEVLAAKVVPAMSVEPAQQQVVEVSPEVKMETPVIVEKTKKEYTFGQIAATPDTVYQGETVGLSSLIGAEAPDVNDENNKAWEARIPKLDRFTKLVHKLGFSVIYQAMEGYPGLVLASIINKETGIVFNLLMIDPCIIYGDTLRVCSLKNADGDIRKEISIAISQENVLEKLITGTMTDQERKAILETLPRAITDFRTGYCLLDRLDLRNIKPVDKNLNFMTWRSIVTKASTILRNVPMSRFRIVNAESKDKFEMHCDTNVLCAYPTTIFNEPSHIELASHGLVILYDAEAYKDNHGYIVKTIDGSPVPFDPYVFLSEEKAVQAQ